MVIIKTLRTTLMASCLSLLSSLPGEAGGRAPVVTDGSLGRRVELGGKDIEVGAELGTRKGQNLFHSFERFDVPTKGSVTFTGPNGIRNVISRVTGPDASSIDGKLASTVPGADVYLLNPNGIVFGPNATLDVPASFHASTADELHLEDGATFSARKATTSGLSVAAPEAFGFLGRGQPGTIQVAGSQLFNTRSLGLVAGNLSVENASIGVLNLVDAIPGQLDLVAEQGPGEVGIDEARAVARDGHIDLKNSGLAVSGPGGGTVRIEGGEIAIADSFVDLNNDERGLPVTGGLALAAGHLVMTGNGSNTTIASTTQGSGSAGPIRVTAGMVDLVGASIFSSSAATGPAGDVLIQADRINVTDRAAVGAPAFFSGKSGRTRMVASDAVIVRNAAVNSSTTGDSNAGSILIQAPEVLITQGGTVLATATAAGGGGDIEISADRLHVTGQGSIQTTSSGSGSAGTIRVAAGQFELDGQSFVSGETFGGGRGGSISVMADAIRIERAFLGTSAASASPTADAGTVRVTARNLTLRNEGRIFNGTTAATDAVGNIVVGAGDGGDIIVSVSGRLVIDGMLDPVRPAFTTGISASANANTTGTGGSVQVTADAIEIRNGGNLSSVTSGRGRAGAVRVTAGGMLVDDGFVGASTASADAGADAGQVSVQADTLTLRNQGRIFNGTSPVIDRNGNVIALGAGDGGDVVVRVKGTLLIDGTLDHVDTQNVTTGISASANPSTTGGAGAVAVAAGQIRVVDGGNVSTSTGGPGAAGSVHITTTSLDMADGGVVSSSSSSTGRGGDVTIRASELRLDHGGQIEAANRDSVSGGDAGAVRIDALRQFDLRGGSVTTEALAGGGGRIVIRGGELVRLEEGSRITSSVEGDRTTTAGDVSIDGQFLVLNRGSQIAARANQGRGGNIRIAADQLVASPDSTIDASAAAGIDGTVVTTSPEVDLTNGLIVLPTTFLNVDRLLQESCSARRGELSSFTATGRGGLPSSPEDALGASYAGDLLAGGAIRANGAGCSASRS